MSGKSIQKQPGKTKQTDSKAIKAVEAAVITSTVTGHYQPVTQPSASSQPNPAASGVKGPELDLVHTSNVATLPDVEVLLVRAVSPNGFHRAGRFWSHEGVNVFVSDDPDRDSEGNVDFPPCISMATAERLKAEPHLHVTMLSTINTEIKGE
ncbi:hypothetical protein [Serratia fonticola]|uniref:hypothetical protein n=1 Tax=Serratia fonticola TaxID=47917 RepID=UPI0013770EB1|nr:hypothetical protein [Serratia fonticola]NCG50550.1 hypothetical protein [Serratia fonticola]